MTTTKMQAQEISGDQLAAVRDAADARQAEAEAAVELLGAAIHALGRRGREYLATRVRGDETRTLVLATDVTGGRERCSHAGYCGQCTRGEIYGSGLAIRASDGAIVRVTWSGTWSRWQGEVGTVRVTIVPETAPMSAQTALSLFGRLAAAIHGRDFATVTQRARDGAARIEAAAVAVMR